MNVRARRTATPELLLGEWACLGVVALRPTHGFAVAARLSGSGDVGRAWTLSRPLTYRAIDRLLDAGLVEVVDHQRGIAGGTRTVVAATGTGRRALRAWLRTPVEHVRDLRSELLVKLVLARLHRIDVSRMLAEQRRRVEVIAAAQRQQADTHDVNGPDDVNGADQAHGTHDMHNVVGAVNAAGAVNVADVVELWRTEMADAAVRFLDRLAPRQATSRSSRRVV